MTPADLGFTELAPGRWETVTRTGREFTVTWAPGLWAVTHYPPDAGPIGVQFDTFHLAARWCAAQCGPDDEEPF